MLQQVIIHLNGDTAQFVPIAEQATLWLRAPGKVTVI